jgi:hypothetical protein
MNSTNAKFIKRRIKANNACIALGVTRINSNIKKNVMIMIYDMFYFCKHPYLREIFVKARLTCECLVI